MNNAKAIFQTIQELTTAMPVAMATIVEVRGSVPREVGAKMIIHPLGQHVGTVGGGCGEADVIKTGLTVIDTGTPQIVEVDLTEDISMQSLGVCGGVMQIFVEPWRNDNAQLGPLVNAIDAGELVALVTVIRADGQFAGAPGRRMVVWPEKTAGELGLDSLEATLLDDARQCIINRRSELLTYQQPHGEVSVFVDVQRRPSTLLIVGAGHVALPLAQLGKLIDFEVVVLDDRPAFANRQRFPMAGQVLAQPLQKTLRQWPINSDTYIVLVTRGHTHDVECLLEVLDSPARYIGMIGSKRRVKAVFELLEREQGLDPARFSRVYSPIGLDIGAETPAEIAVAVIAEIINVYRGGRAVSLAETLRADYRLPLHPGRLK